jgi:hypothetical protein
MPERSVAVTHLAERKHRERRAGEEKANLAVLQVARSGTRFGPRVSDSANGLLHKLRLWVYRLFRRTELNFGAVSISFRGARIEFRKLQIRFMRKLLYILPFALIAVGASLVFQQRAYAYADPGTGLLAIQALGSAVVATGWYLRRKIYGLLHRGAKLQQPEEELPATKEDEGSSLP